MQHEQDRMSMGRLTLLGPTYPINLAFVTHDMGDKRLPDQHDKDAKVRQANGQIKKKKKLSQLTPGLMIINHSLLPCNEMLK